MVLRDIWASPSLQASIPQFIPQFSTIGKSYEERTTQNQLRKTWANKLELLDAPGARFDAA